MNIMQAKQSQVYILYTLLVGRLPSAFVVISQRVGDCKKSCWGGDNWRQLAKVPGKWASRWVLPSAEVAYTAV